MGKAFMSSLTLDGAAATANQALERNTTGTLIAAERVVPLDRARTFITLLVVLHHSVINYTSFGNGDRMRWLGFDLVVLFNDSFFMACMFFISGLFVRTVWCAGGPQTSWPTGPGDWACRS